MSGFDHKTGLSQTSQLLFMFQCNEHVEICTHCAPTHYVHTINECFDHKTGLSQTSQLLFMFKCNEHVEMNTFLCSLCSLACTWMTIIYH